MHFGIIAAGEGSRLAQEGVQLPKPLVRISGQPMIGRLIGLFLRCGAESVNVVVNSRMPEVKKYLDSLAPTLPVPLNVKVKSTPSSMHTFWELSTMLEGKGRFIATTVDTVFREEDFSRYVDAFRNAPADVDGMMALTSFIEDEKPLYVDVDDGMNILGFLDAPNPAITFISGGIYGLDSRSAIPVLRRCLDSGVSRMRNYQRALVDAGLRLKGFDMGKVVDVDHAGDIAGAEAFLAGE